MPDEDFEAKLENLRAEYEFIGPKGNYNCVSSSQKRRLGNPKNMVTPSHHGQHFELLYVDAKFTLTTTNGIIDREIRCGRPKLGLGALLIGDGPPDWAIRYIMACTLEFYSRYSDFRKGQKPNNPDDAFCEAFRIKTGKKDRPGDNMDRLP